MKKILSFVLALGMMLSMLSIIPAQAAPTEDYPYIYEDFEADRGNTTGGVATWVNEGAHGTNGALYFNQTKDADDINVFLPDHSIISGKFKMSAWVKLDTTKTKLKGEKFGFVFWAPATDTPDGKYDDKPNHLNPSSWEMDWTVNVDKNALNRGEWVYVERIVENWDGVMRHGIYTPDAENAIFKFAPRLGSPGDGKIGNIVADDSPTKSVCWYLDDFIVEPIVEPYGAGEGSDGSNVMVDVDFSEPMSAYNKQISISTNNGQIENGAFHFTSKGGAYNNINIKELPIKYNKIYKFTFRAKANDDATVGTMMKLIAIRGTKPGDTSKKDVNDPFYHYQFVRAMDTVTGEQGKLTKEWRNYELYMTRQVKAAFHPPLSFNFRAYGPVKLDDKDAGMEAVDFMVDDLKLEELPTVMNGDFSLLKGDLVTTYEDSNANNNDSKLYGTFYGWRDKGATVQKIDGAAKVTVTEENGHIEQGVHIKNHSMNVITFRAKGEGDSVGKPIQVKLDRDVTTKDERDVYGVNTEIIGENLVLTDDWKEYSIRYDLDVKTPAGANDSAEPRAPYLSFVVDGGAKGLTYYVDDVVIAPYIPPYELPYATDLAIDGAALAGENVTFSYLYNNDIENYYEGNSVVRVLKKVDGGYVTIAQYAELSNVYDIHIPEETLGSKLKIEIMPITEPDENGKVRAGAPYAIETDTVKSAYVIKPSLGSFDAESGSITGTLAVENNKPDGDSLDLFLAIVLYDADGGIVRYDSEPISVGAASSDDIKLSVSTADAEGLASVAYAKAFTWAGSGIFDTDLTSYAETITVNR